MACAIFSLLLTVVLVNALPTLNRFLDRGSEFNVEREVRELKFRLDGLLLRAATFRRDFTLIASPVQPNEFFFVKWEGDTTQETWRMENIAVKSSNAGVYSFVYSHLHQTLTPALTLRVYRKEGAGLHVSPWRVSISGYGFVRAYKTPR